LEARWAANWDVLVDREEIEGWEYEPVCFADGASQYLPDFRLTYSDGDVYYIEVKPGHVDPAPIMQQMEVVLASEPDAVLFIFAGLPGDSRGWCRFGSSGDWSPEMEGC
jgi:hypothetical protein